MRENKYMIWDKELNCWRLDLDFHITFDEDTGAMKVPENMELVQYTGLKDRNGKEIYEGDLLFTNGNLSEEFDQFVGVVRFDEEVAGFVCENFPFIPNQDCIVIGNIYENPELLEAN